MRTKSSIPEPPHESQTDNATKPSFFAKATAALKARWQTYKDGAPERQRRREEKLKQAQVVRDLKRREAEAKHNAKKAKLARLKDHDYERKISIAHHSKLGVGPPLLIECSDYSPPPEQSTGSGNIRLTMQRRRVTYRGGEPRSELLVWLHLSETAQALLRSAGLDEVSLYETTHAKMNVYKEQPAPPPRKYQEAYEMVQAMNHETVHITVPFLTEYLPNPRIFSSPNPLDLEEFANGIKASLKNLHNHIEALVQRADNPNQSDVIEF